jgi:DNA-binding MarR family transcriptional regulator
MLNWKEKALKLDHEAMLDILRMYTWIFKLSDRFFSQYDITDAQFAVLMTLSVAGASGLSQQELSEHLIVHKSNITGLIDRLEKKGYVMRKPQANDRRVNRIVLGEKGIGILNKVEKPYLDEVQRMMSKLTMIDKMTLRKCAEKITKYANVMLQPGSNWPAPAK